MFYFFFFNDTATTEIYTLSLHDALPIFFGAAAFFAAGTAAVFLAAALLAVAAVFLTGLVAIRRGLRRFDQGPGRSEEHTSELQSQSNLVCRLLLEKKKKRCKHVIVYRLL